MDEVQPGLSRPSIREWLQAKTKPFLAVLPLVLVALRLYRISHGRLSTELQLFESGGTFTVVYGALAPVFPYLLFLATTVSIVVAVRDWPDRSSRERSLVLGTVGACLTGIVVLTVPLVELLYLSAWVVLLIGSFNLAYRLVMWNSSVRWPAVFISAVLAFLLIQVSFDDRPWNVPELLVYSTHPVGVAVTPAGGAAPPAGAAVQMRKPTSYFVGYVMKSGTGDVTVMDAFNRTIVRIATARRGQPRRLQG